MRQHHYKRKKEPADLDVTTFMNLMVVLVPFLLITAVFSRITIVELDLPSSRGAAAPSAPVFRPEVVVRESGLEITNGRQIIAAIPKVDGEFDLVTLGDYMLELKREYPDVSGASVLLEPQIPYDYLVRVMDVVRSAEVEAETAGIDVETLAAAADTAVSPGPAGADDQTANGQSVERFVRVALFPDIAIGEAP
jgi:biopolymer transport protein ExbD